MGDYPSAGTIDLEVAYNHWLPFRIASICLLLALAGMLLAWALRRRPLFWVAIGFYAAGTLAMAAGFCVRAKLSGHVPVTNMYESVVFVGFGTVLFGLVFEIISRKRYALVVAAAVSALALVLADNCPTILDPSIRPLTPVLRNNMFLATHVVTIMLSYAALAIAWLGGNIALWFYLTRSPNQPAIVALSKLTYRFLQAGTLLLILGTFLGGMWADRAWGRFWAWDPKEAWALITLLGYFASCTPEKSAGCADFGMAALSVVCFVLVLVTWYVVNYILAGGLHTYGSGGASNHGYILAALAVQFVYVGAATLRAIEERHIPPSPSAA